MEPDLSSFLKFQKKLESPLKVQDFTVFISFRIALAGDYGTRIIKRLVIRVSTFCTTKFPTICGQIRAIDWHANTRFRYNPRAQRTHENLNQTRKLDTAANWKRRGSSIVLKP